VHHGRRHLCRYPDGGTQGDEQQPESLEEQVGREHANQINQQGEHAECGAGRGQWNHDQIGRDANQGELIEVSEHDRRHRGLSAQAHRRRRGEPRGPCPSCEPGGDGGREVDDPGRGREG
jgi:hypothetical protein